MMTTRYDDEIRELELRLERERASLAEGTDELAGLARSTAARARAAAVSPRGLVGALALGYLLGELTRRRRPKPASEATVTRKVGLGGLVGGAALALIRAQYGSPVAFARAMWSYVDEWRRARAGYPHPAGVDPYSYSPARRPGWPDPDQGSGTGAPWAPPRP